jgi:hypothetical protein
MVEGASTFGTSANFYQTTRRNNPEDSHLHIRRRENLKSHALSDFPLISQDWFIIIVPCFLRRFITLEVDTAL